MQKLEPCKYTPYISLGVWASQLNKELYDTLKNIGYIEDSKFCAL